MILGNAADDPHVPEADLVKRRAAHEDKKSKMTNPTFYISPLRLSVRNVSKEVDDHALREIFIEAARVGVKQKVGCSVELHTNQCVGCNGDCIGSPSALCRDLAITARFPRSKVPF